MEYEYDVRAIPMDNEIEFKRQVDQLQAEGWQIPSGIRPVAIYHLVRPKVQAHDISVKMAIDDSKIGILRDGKLVS